MVPLDQFLKENIPVNNILNLSFRQQKDVDNCGVFALENAKIIVDGIIAKKDFEAIRKDIKNFIPSSNELKNKRIEFARTLNNVMKLGINDPTALQEIKPSASAVQGGGIIAKDDRTSATWTLAVAGILAVIAASVTYFAFSTSLLATVIIAGIGVFYLVAAAIIYCCRPKSSIENNKVEKSFGVEKEENVGITCVTS